MKIEEYMSELAKASDFVENFGDYANANSDYICDIIMEIADDNVSIYTDAQIEFAMNNGDWVEQAFFSGIAPDGAEYFKNNHDDFRGYCAKVGVAAWYEKNTQELYNNLEECVLYAVCEYLQTEHGYTELDDIDIKFLENLDFDSNDRLSEVFVDAENALGIGYDDNEEDED